MSVEFDKATSTCSHCDRPIPAANFDLHYAHCVRNLEKCKICADMIPKRLAEEHFATTHAPVTCSLCNEMMERDTLPTHKSKSCPQRMVTCEFCEFPLPAVDLAEHQDVCGNRTELCYRCNKYVRLLERYRHEATCNGISTNGISENAGGSSRSDARAAETEQPPRRRQPQNYSRRRMLFTIAITGIAIVLGSLFFPRKAQINEVQ